MAYIDHTPHDARTAYNLVWDTGTLQWVVQTSTGGGGGGATTIADGADVAQGTTTDAAVITDTSGTLSGKLRGLVKWAFERMPASLGQKTLSASFPVAIASDQSALPAIPASLTSFNTYRVGLQTGAVVSAGAGGSISSIRWTDGTRFLVLLRVRVGFVVTGAVTAAVPAEFGLVFLRSFTTDFTTNRTVTSLTGVTNTQKVRSSLTNSLMGANGPCIATTTNMTGNVATGDTAYMALCTSVNQPSGNATVTQAVGVGCDMKTLYERTALGEYPIVLAQNEGLIVTLPSGSPTTGTTKYNVEWTWAEVDAF